LFDFQYLNHRCITTQECKNLNINKKNDPPFIPFRGICQEGCPLDFQIKYAVTGNKMSASCTPCLGKECWRKCKSVIIDSVEAAEALKGCQIVDGSLEIQIKSKLGVNIEEVLENSLSQIIEIENYLKVSRSFPIISLKFLKNLKVIHGTQLESNKYSIVIWDNQNIEKLFDENQKLEVKSGKLFVHFNPKLCFDKVDQLSKSTLQAIQNLENAQLSNGDKAHCNISKIEVEMLEVLADSAHIKWTPLKIDDNEAILEYVIFFISAPEQNIDLWNSRDTCGNDGLVV
jgi:insulin receptor